MKYRPFLLPDGTSLLSRVIDISRFPMMLLVVLIHSNILTSQSAMTVPTFADDTIYYLSCIICRVAVPLFFFLSGFLFFYNKNTKQPGFYRSQLKKRVKTLVVPYILWNTVAFVFLWIKTLPSMSPYFPRLAGQKLGLVDFINAYGPFTFKPMHGMLGNYDPASAPADVPLWYVRDLLAIMLFAPLIYRMVKGKMGGFACSVLILLFLSGTWPKACFWFDLTGVCFFCFGAFFAVNRIDPVKVLGFYKLEMSLSVFALLYLVCTGFCMAFRHGPFGLNLIALSILIGVPVFLLSCALLAKRNFKVFPFLQNALFFMYAFHGLISSIIKKVILLAIAPESSIGYIAADLTVMIVLVLVSLLLFKILDKVSPRFCMILSGTRTSK